MLPLRTPLARARSPCHVYACLVHVFQLSFSPRQPYPRELPSRVRREEVPVGPADVPGRRRAGAAAEDELVAHELPVVLPDRPRRGLEARVGGILAPRPFPDVAV